MLASIGMPMIIRRLIATMILSLMVADPLFAQVPARDLNQVERSRAATQNNQIEAIKRVYASCAAAGNERCAALYASQLGQRFEDRQDFPNAAIWWRNSYARGNAEGMFHFVNLIILNEITIDNPEKVRPLIEVRAFCGSQMARAYLLDHWHETPAQLPAYDFSDPSLAGCGPVAVSTEDRIDQSLLIQARQRQSQKDQQATDEYYRLHPDQDPKVKAKNAAEGAAMFLGALLIMGASMPASGPGSIACNRYQNKYPGANDPSVCNILPPK